MNCSKLKPDCLKLEWNSKIPDVILMKMHSVFSYFQRTLLVILPTSLAVPMMTLGVLLHNRCVMGPATVLMAVMKKGVNKVQFVVKCSIQVFELISIIIFLVLTEFYLSSSSLQIFTLCTFIE